MSPLLRRLRVLRTLVAYHPTRSRARLPPRTRRGSRRPLKGRGPHPCGSGPRAGERGRSPRRTRGGRAQRACPEDGASPPAGGGSRTRASADDRRPRAPGDAGRRTPTRSRPRRRVAPALRGAPPGGAMSPLLRRLRVLRTLVAYHPPRSRARLPPRTRRGSRRPLKGRGPLPCGSGPRGCGGGSRTRDLQGMSLTRYHFSTPRWRAKGSPAQSPVKAAEQRVDPPKGRVPPRSTRRRAAVPTPAVATG